MYWPTAVQAAALQQLTPTSEAPGDAATLIASGQLPADSLAAIACETPLVCW